MDRWGFWAQDTPAVRASPGVLSLGNQGQWSLGSPEAVAVRPGQVWILSALVAGRGLGWLGGGGASIAFVASDSAGRVIDWQAGEAWKSGTFGWTPLSAKVTVPRGVASLTPRFSGHGGGTFFIAAAGLDSSGRPPSLPPPPASIPAAPALHAVIPVASDSQMALYRPGETIGWTLLADPAGFPAPLRFSVSDAYGTVLDSGHARPGERIRFRPPHAGYYELRVGQAVLRDGDSLRVSAFSGAAVIPPPKRWRPGGNPFGFEAEDSLLARLGFTWSRPLHYNILDGSHDRLPSDTAAYAAAWRAKLKSRRLPRTHLNAIEVWNEPRNELAKGWTMRDFVSMVSATARGARSADPAVRIAVNWEWVDNFPEFHRAGGARHYQVAALHPYTMGLFRDPPDCHASGPEADGLPEYLDRARDSIPGKEIWSTEFGWPTAPGRCWSVSELDQARYIVRSSLIQLSKGLTRVLPYSERDYPERGALHGSFGLRRADLGPKPALAAYAALARAVDDLPYAGRIHLGKARAAVFLFGRGNRTVAAGWSPYGDTLVALKIPQGVRKMDLFGGESVVRKGEAGWVLGPSPAYLFFAAPPSKAASRLGGKLVPGRPKGGF